MPRYTQQCSRGEDSELGGRARSPAEDNDSSFALDTEDSFGFGQQGKYSAEDEKQDAGVRLCSREVIWLLTGMTGVPLERELCDQNILSGSRTVLWVVKLHVTMVMMLAVVLAFRGITIRQMVHAIGICRLVLYCVVQVLTLVCMWCCQRRPRLRLYLTMITIWIAFLVWLHTFPPTWELEARAVEPIFGRQQELGYAAIHWHMVALFLLPLLIPERRFMSVFLGAFMGVFIIVMCVFIALDPGLDSDMGGYDSNGRLISWKFLCNNTGGEDSYVRFYSSKFSCNVDFMVGLLALSAACFIVCKKKHAMEAGQLTNFGIALRKKRATVSLFEILSCMLPPFAIVPLLDNQVQSQTFAYRVDHASILFIKFVDFDQIVRSTSSPTLLLEFLNRYFTKMDEICDEHGVTKIETVGDEYVCAVGVKPNVSRRLESVKQLVLVGRRVLRLQLQLPGEEPVAFQMGIHTGPVVAGVVGRRLPRFRIFGDTMNTAARMMQKGIPGKMQFGDATRQELPPSITVQERGEIEMKGKGWVMTYLLGSDHSGSAQTGPMPSICGAQRLRPGITRMLIDAAETEFEPVMPHHISVETALENAFRLLAQGSATVVRSKTLQLSAHGCFSRLVWSKRMQRVSEKDFCKWYHANCFCKNLPKRLRDQAKCFTGLTVVETLYILCNNGFKVLRGHAVFLACRLTCIIIMLAWLILVGSSSLVGRSPRWSQRGILISWCIILVLNRFAYSALPYIFLLRPEAASFPLHGISKNAVLLSCFPVCTWLMRAHPFTFIQSWIFVVVMLLLLIFEHMSRMMDMLPKSIHHNVFMNTSFLLNSVVCSVFAYQQEAMRRDRHVAQLAVTQTLRSLKDILSTLMPPMVAHSLRKGLVDVKPQHHYLRATVVQSDLAGFTQLASTRAPEAVVQIISDLFGLFDDLADEYGIYKVETVGDAYIAGSAEAPLTAINSPLCVVLFGLAMIEGCCKWSERHGEDVSCRVGVHTGECVGGIVGHAMQRYHLFGALMTELDLLESTAPKGRIQLSRACKRAVERDPYHVEGRPPTFEARTELELLTSKGEVHSFAEVGGPTFLVSGAA